MKRVLIIAASDSGGGAGIQADIKTVTLCGAFAMTAITALTAQNTRGVENVLAVAPSFIQQQIEVVLSDIGADAVKTGMLVNAETISAVAQSLNKYPDARLVIDPVMKAKSGHSLLAREAMETLRQKLLPRAFIITPNLDEASALCGRTVDSLDGMQEAARSIHGMGPRYVLIKGGHLAGDCCDLLYDGAAFTRFDAPRIATASTHGTGCTLASAIAAELAKGLEPGAAVRRAKEFITTAIRFAVPLGSGHGPTNPYANIARDAQVMQCCRELEAAFLRLQEARIGCLIPEVQSNFGYATPAAVSPDDVVAFPGRIIRLHDSITRVAAPAAGASRHIARVILTARGHDTSCRAAMNIAWSPEIIDRCRNRGLLVAEFSRGDEPPNVREIEGSTLEWGTRKAISETGRVPDIIYDHGGAGKEPMTRVLGTDPMAVALKILSIAKET